LYWLRLGYFMVEHTSATTIGGFRSQPRAVQQRLFEMGWEEYRVEKWEDFVSMVEAFGIGEHGDTNWFFRGQSKEEWDLTPSLGRLFEPDSDVRYGLHVESRATNLFRERFHLNHDADGVNRDDWSIHALFRC